MAYFVLRTYRTRLNRMKYRIALLLLLVLQLHLAAIPVKRPFVTVTQPDGQTFVLKCSGDAFHHLLTTEDGCAVIRQDDGSYHYAAFDAQGFRHSTPYALGQQDVPQEVIQASRRIPYDLLSRNAMLRREVTRPFPRPNLEQRYCARHPATRGATAPRHGLVILAEFEDVRFRYTRDDFDRLLNGGGGRTAVDYFNDQFHGAYDFRFTVSDIVPLSHKQAYYGKNDSEGHDIQPSEMIREACILADAQIDYSVFDEDGDGEVDNVFVFFAGKDEADDPDRNADCIWSHAYYLTGDGIHLKMDGVTLDRYACTSELMILFDTGKYTMASIGTFCHEYSHTFGLPDFYDTDYESSGGDAEALWHSLSLMDGGNMNGNGYTPPYYNAVERMELGIAEPLPLSPGSYALEPVRENNRFYIIETDEEEEFYLLECRDNEGWDAEIGGTGLLIYHIDQSRRPAGLSDTYKKVFSAEQRWIYNEVNCRPDRQCADLVEADPAAEPDSYGSQVKRVFWPQQGRTEFSAMTDPAFVFWSGTESTLSLTQIRKQGNSVLFTVVGGSIERAPEVLFERQDIYQDAAIIQWSASDPEYTRDGYISFSTDGKDPVEHAVAPYAPGRYAFVIEGLSPRTPYKATLYFKAGEITGKVNEDCRFTTKSQYKGTYPYIYLTDAERTDGGAFVKGTEIPLRVCNAADAGHVSWTFNGNPVTPGGNGYFPLTESGTLTADIVRSDGVHERILKKITVR